MVKKCPGCGKSIGSDKKSCGKGSCPKYAAIKKMGKKGIEEANRKAMATSKISREKFTKWIKKNYPNPNWNFISDGAPDYCIFNDKTKEAIFIELKSGSGRPTKNQNKWIEILKTYKVKDAYIKFFPEK